MGLSRAIRIRGARQNNLKNLDLDLPLGELIVVTGVSGSGKSSLVFDTLYAEGQRRYVETFSAYARQFLDRMDKPQVDRIEGVPPAIAIDQTNPVRTSRSTVGTMTELTDHLKLLYARTASLTCRSCAKPVKRQTAQGIVALIAAHPELTRVEISFSISAPKSLPNEQIEQWLSAQGFTRIQSRDDEKIFVIQDRLILKPDLASTRLAEAVEAALRYGAGQCRVSLVTPDQKTLIHDFSSRLYCTACNLHYAEPRPALFSFNSPIGACDTCRGFGRVIGIDPGLVIPDESKSLAEGAIKPWQTNAYSDCQKELLAHAMRQKISTRTPWRELSEREKTWVLNGDPKWSGDWNKQWYGVYRFFEYLESKAYKMHVRVLLSRYRSYTECASCHGARLKPEALLWRCAEKTIHEVMCLPIDAALGWVDGLARTLDGEGSPGHAGQSAATEVVIKEIRSRLGFLVDVGLGYLTLDRQSRTLSGGEVQRINLTTALGTSLVNTLFVLDEPSIGLHPRDLHRIVKVMHNLRDAGNTLVVVEHDPMVMQAADRIIDIGPGPGEHGGEILFNGSFDDLLTRTTLTARYLKGELQTAPERKTQKPSSKKEAYGNQKIVLKGASANNLKHIDFELPLHRLVCITGVSGSGKSTLVQDVLYPAILKAKGKSTESPGAFDRLVGAELINDVVLVDQSPIGKTTRSNPAVYVGAFDAIRARFADSPTARQRQYTAGTFSFNAGDGRCPTCSGSGFEHIEMQFLSDVYLRCADCMGSRFRPEILEVRLRGRSIADVLEMTVSEALGFFADDPDVIARLGPLSDVGLSYVRLGQPVPTLSGGEAQRLKIAGHLSEAASKNIKGALLIFDEPTTGLHFDDIAKLLKALTALRDAGHSLVVIEHNLDVVSHADWIVDLGPEAGDDGGAIVCAGSIDDVMACPDSHTGKALRDYRNQSGVLYANEPNATAPARHEGRHNIEILGAREHNLKNVHVEIPREKMTVITGVSGSGKSTLAFDILFAEGQRRYLESLNAYARQFVQPASRPEVDAIFGIPPTVAIEQRTSRGGRKSTVGTLTEIHHFLRLLFVKLGTQHCPDCQTAIKPQSTESILSRILRDLKGQHVGFLAPLVVNRKGIYQDLAKWAAQKNYTHLRVDGQFVTTKPFPKLDRFKEHSIELPVGDAIVRAENEKEIKALLQSALDLGQGVVQVLAPLEKPERAKAHLFSTRRACPSCGTGFAELDPRLFSYNSKHGWCEGCFGTGVVLAEFDAEQSGEEESWRTDAETDVAHEPMACPQCEGFRLNPTALGVRIGEHNIAQVAKRPMADIPRWISGLHAHFNERDQTIAKDLLAEIGSRLEFLNDVGLGYLALDRAAPTLSGGEAQRIRLAAQLGSNLQGVCYILDEPTIGLHPKDNQALLKLLERLKDKGNTLVVVEHDEDTIRLADHLIDIGPGAGRLGGAVVAQGTIKALKDAPESLTGQYLRSPMVHHRTERRPPAQAFIEIQKADLHNLQSIDVAIPLNRLTVITGVSGSGKSTLARDVLLTNLQSAVAEKRNAKKQSSKGTAREWLGCKNIRHWQSIERVLEVDQTPIGKTPRSTSATYIGFWDDIRTLLAESEEAKMRGWKANRFSFNTGDGRCMACEGQGWQTVEMNFLPDVRVLCDACQGSRFNPETRAVMWRGKNVSDILAMTVDMAVEFFESHPSVNRPLRLLQDVGLGYLTLGQPSPTLSGGEAQRIKLVTELAKASTRSARGSAHTLYVLDEPTVGLHMADIEKLIGVLHRLIDAGNTVVVIEHQLDIWAQADWIIDLGPDGGRYGGKLVGSGPARDIARRATHTGRALAEFFKTRR